MMGLRGFGAGLAILGAVLATASLADEMSSEEIIRRLELQGVVPSGGATRGLTLSYGDDAPEPLVYTPVRDEARIDLQIYFEWNSASLKPEAIGQLSHLCAAIRQVADTRQFRIIGHTDKSGSDDYNLYLSQARAREVKRHLVEECAISRDSLLATGEGERQADPAAPQRNPVERRVEVQVVG